MMFEGSNVDGFSRTENAYLIRKIGEQIIPGINPEIRVDWFYADKGWMALDEAQKDFGNCEILKSCTQDYIQNLNKTALY